MTTLSLHHKVAYSLLYMYLKYAKKPKISHYRVLSGTVRFISVWYMTVVKYDIWNSVFNVFEFRTTCSIDRLCADLDVKP